MSKSISSGTNKLGMSDHEYHGSMVVEMAVTMCAWVLGCVRAHVRLKTGEQQAGRKTPDAGFR